MDFRIDWVKGRVLWRPRATTPYGEELDEEENFDVDDDGDGGQDWFKESGNEKQ